MPAAKKTVAPAPIPETTLADRVAQLERDLLSARVNEFTLKMLVDRVVDLEGRLATLTDADTTAALWDLKNRMLLETKVSFSLPNPSGRRYSNSSTVASNVPFDLGSPTGEVVTVTSINATKFSHNDYWNYTNFSVVCTYMWNGTEYNQEFDYSFGSGSRYRSGSHTEDNFNRPAMEADLLDFLLGIARNPVPKRRYW